MDRAGGVALRGIGAVVGGAREGAVDGVGAHRDGLPDERATPGVLSLQRHPRLRKSHL